MTGPKSSAQARGKLRVIGGTLRGRRLDVTSHPALRPTPDRVRETLFNWLRPVLPGAACLDLFAGTGVLGIEALSRGAAQSCFVESDARLAAALEACLAAFGLAAASRVYHQRAERFLAAAPERLFNIVFLDPPYAVPLAPWLPRLSGWLAPGALIYVERPAAAGLPESVRGFAPVKQARAGRVCFGLLEAAGPA
jgi:16S rRNA (guanine966-N2)-methyltransferase